MTAPGLHIDFETRSAVDLKTAGAFVYAEHPTTDVWCAAYAFGDGPVEVWRPGDPADAITEHIRSGGEVIAHNAAFEAAIVNRVLAPRHGWPTVDVAQLRCTMAQALAYGRPAGLDAAAKALGLPQEKDEEGYRLMLRMSRPRRKPDPECLMCHGTGVADVVGARPEHCACLTWWEIPERVDRLVAYCRQDVVVERALDERLPRLSDDEAALWRADQEINNRGVAVDLAACEAAKEVVIGAHAELHAAIRRVTGGAVTKASEVAKLLDWCRDAGVGLASLDKAALAEALARADLPPAVREELEIRREFAKTSVKKLDALIVGANADGRIRGLLQYHAAHTGRWGGRRFQPQNLPRTEKGFTPELAMPALLTGDAETVRMIHGRPLGVVSNALRSLLVAAPGHVLVAADYSNIEGRVLAWLAGEKWKLDAFRAFDRGEGPDLYKVAYGRAFGVDPSAVNGEQRQVGKVMELALGYQGGVGAFQTMARGYGVEVSDERAAELRDAWRDAHPDTRFLWRSLEKAALDAVRKREPAHLNGKLTFFMDGTVLHMRLPSGRCLHYHDAAVRPKTMPYTDDWGMPVKRDVLAFRTVQLSGRWDWSTAYGGLLAENAVQAISRDILAGAIRRLHARGARIVLHVHDEIVTEEPEETASIERLAEAMFAISPWLHGCPVVADGWIGQRYRK